MERSTTPSQKSFNDGDSEEQNVNRLNKEGTNANDVNQEDSGIFNPLDYNTGFINLSRLQGRLKQNVQAEDNNNEITTSVSPHLAKKYKYYLTKQQEYFQANYDPSRIAEATDT